MYAGDEIYDDDITSRILDPMAAPRPQTVEHPNIEHGVDEQVLDWYAGATQDYDGTLPEPVSDHWYGGEASLAFGDIGPWQTDDGPRPHAQLVMHFLPHDGWQRGRAISLEIDHHDATLLIQRLSTWIEETQEPE